MFYLIDKPKDISSFKAIRDFSKKIESYKIGHSGTLDPLATGALLVATNESTKLLPYIIANDKTYTVTMKTGFISDSYDSTGQLEIVNPDKIVSLDDISSFLDEMVGDYIQEPPIFSAKKVNGVRAYHLARQGKEVKLKKNKVKIYSYSNLVKEKSGDFSFSIKVSKGTYIRSIVNDLGNRLGTGAYMTELRRTAIGDLDLHDSVQEIDAEKIISLDIIEIKNIDELLNGKKIEFSHNDGEYVIKYNKMLCGIVKIEKNIMSVKKIFGRLFI